MFKGRSYGNRDENQRIACGIQVKTKGTCCKNPHSQFETGKANPGYDVLITLADFFEVSVDYLPGRADEAGNVKILPDKTGVYPSADEAELLALYRRADETGKARIKAYAEGCAAAN